MKSIVFSILFFLVTYTSFSQDRGCRTMEAFAERVSKGLSSESVLLALQKEIPLRNTLNKADTLVVPVVVHVVYKLMSENISDAQIYSQLGVINEDFLKIANSNGDNTHPLGVNTLIRFELAKNDQYGNPTTGITRTQTTRSEFSDNDYVKMSNYGGKDPWPADSYLNLWVCNLQTFYLGYSSFPGDNMNVDGVVIDYKAFGNTGTASVPYNLGRTTTHELGHWLGLFHIWGDDETSGNVCMGTDYISDTPNQGGPTVDCPTDIQISCNNGPDGDMYQNYMDYTEDACLNMFTKGQALKMQYVYNTYRYELKNSPGLENVSVSSKVVQPLSMYPNPSNGIIYLADIKTKDAILNVYNSIGVLVYHQPIVSERIDLGDLGPGVYYIYLIQDNKPLANKLIIE